MSSPPLARIAVLLAAAPGFLMVPAGGPAPREQVAIERVGVDLILLDVEARDPHGVPLRGLGPGDFDVFVDGVRRVVYSADDRCRCGDRAAPAPREASAAGVDPTSAGSAARADLRPRDDPHRFVFYFDFALMAQDGRVAAIREARRWIRETMRDGDEVMIVGSTFAGGAVRLTRFTTDRGALLSALERMEGSREFVDPHMSFLSKRIDKCLENHRDPMLRRSLPDCNINAMEEYQHTHGTLRTLDRFMDTLDAVPGHKQLVLFHEIAPFAAAALYPGARPAGTQGAVVEEIGAAAVASHVTVHAAATEGAGDVGRLLAEYTGGSYNRGARDLSPMLDAMHDRCACIYRIGIEPLAREKGRVITVTVSARSRPIANLRVLVRTDAARWLNQARHVLSDPSAARNLPVSAALVPVSAARNRWSVKVQVALHASALTKLPDARGSLARWEVGALLTREGSRKTWEMLAESSMRASSTAVGPEWFVNERTLEDLPPGKYRLDAFVRDRTVDLFGGASSELELVEPSSRGVVGPIALLADRRSIRSALPLRGGGPVEETRSVAESSGLVPAGTAPDGGGGPPFRILTWVCGTGDTGASAPDVSRYLRDQDTAARSLPGEGAWSPAGACLRLTDTLGASQVHGSPARYHVRLKWGGATEPADAELELP